jgi:hypothetical protein
MLVIRVSCLLENRLEGLNAPSSWPVIGTALIFEKVKRGAARSYVNDIQMQICSFIDKIPIYITPVHSIIFVRHVG